MQEVLYKWSFNNKKERSQLWYIISLSISISLIIWGFVIGSYMMSLVILMIIGLYFFIENNASDEIKIEISELGIKIGNSFYDYSKIGSFTFIYEGDSAILLRLSLRTNSIKIIDLSINNDIVINLKNLLPNFISENPQLELSISEKIIRMLKL